MASKERLDVVKSLMACKPKPGASICAFVLEMKGYFDRLESLNMVFDAELSINIILSAATCGDCWSQSKEKERPLIHNWKGKAAKEGALIVKRRLPMYPEGRQKLERSKKRVVDSGIFNDRTPKYYNSDSWVLDTGRVSVSHLHVLQGLKESRKLMHGVLNLVMGKHEITQCDIDWKVTSSMLKSGV
ncbi:hypothetical protein Tco_1575507 [Tanacetum coccineum]